MSHHSSQDNPEMQRAMSDMMKSVLGEYPDGKMSKDDEGGVVMAVTHESGRVKLAFPKPVAWVGLKPIEAIDLAELLIMHAKRGANYTTELDAKIAALTASLAK